VKARILLLVLLIVALPAGAGAHDDPFEVWAVDQSNTTGTTSGGTLYVYDGHSLQGRAAANAVPERFDLGAATQSLCLAQTGTAPVRPHMLLFNAAHSHAILSFVASGHVVFFDAPTRLPLACIDVGAQAHAAVPSPDQSYVMVANQNGKLLQRIATSYATNTFVLEPAATLDLANGLTPSGAARQDALLRPDNAPICPLVDSSSRFTFVTLRGGGLFVVNSRATPMQIIAEYNRDTVHGNGCGGVETAGKMYVNSGGGTAANLHEFDVYAFLLSEFSTTPSPPNTPAPKLVVSQDDRGETDSHGVTLTRQGRFLWVADRAGNRIVVIRTNTDTVEDEFSLVGPFTADPSPDLMVTSPSGIRVFVSLRGALPLSGDPHASTGSTPGVGVIRIVAGGGRGVLEAIAPISNVDAGGVDRADPHGIALRRK
jgi:DNA-binding beta-propeller fold protein YncE